MANYASLKAAINAVIKANGNKEITGTVLNETLTAMVNSLGADYQFAGVATPSTNPGTPDQNVFYLAHKTGLYANFGGLVVEKESLYVLSWNGEWNIDDSLDLEEIYDSYVQQFIELLAEYQPIVIEGNVTNAPDEEDLTSVDQGGTDVLKFKNKAFLPAYFTGLGRIYLRKNIVDGKNLLTQAMISDANTIYHIQYDYELAEDITVPANCVLKFEGGSIELGSYNINFTTPIVDTARMSWFKPTNDDSNLLQILANTYTTVLIDRDIVINSTVNIDKNEKCEIIGDGKSVIKFTNNNEKYPVVFTHSESLRLYNLIIDFEQLQHPKPLEGGDTDSTVYFRIKDANPLVEFSNIVVKNYWKHSVTGEKDSFYIFWFDHLSNTINIHDCRFTDMYCVSNSTQDISNNAGVARCIEIYGSKMDYDTDKPNVISSGSITINNMYFERCFGVTVDGTPVVDDFDSIQVLLEPFRSGYPLDPNSPQIGISVTISNCEFHTCSKRAIKLQASNGLISNILYENSEGNNGGLNVPLNTVIQCFGSNNKLEKIFIQLYDASAGYAIVLAGTNSILSDSVIIRKYYRAAYTTYGVLAYVGTTIERCLIQNFTKPIVGRKTDDYVYGIDYRLLDLTITIRDCIFPKLSSTASNTQDCIYWDLTPEASAGDTTKYCLYKFYNCSFTNHIFYVPVTAEFYSCNFTVDEVVQSRNYMIETYNYDTTRSIGLTIMNCRLSVSDDSAITMIIFNRINDIVVRDMLYGVTGTIQYETVAGISLIGDNGSNNANILVENVLSVSNSYTLDYIIGTNNPGGSASLNHNYIIKNCNSNGIFVAFKAITGKAYIQDCKGIVQTKVACPNLILDIPNLAEITLAEYAQSSLRIGSYKFDSGIPKWWNGTAWVDATGN